jgi:hypothetical protein
VADGVDLRRTGLGEHPVDEGVERGEVVGARAGVVLVREQQLLRVAVAREAEELALELLGRARLAVDEDDGQHRPVLGQRRDVPSASRTASARTRRAATCPRLMGRPGSNRPSPVPATTPRSASASMAGSWTSPSSSPKWSTSEPTGPPSRDESASATKLAI